MRRLPVLRLPGKQRAHERPLVTEHAPAFISYLIGRDKFGIDPEQGTVLLVGGKAGEAEKRERLVAGALAWQEIAVVRAEDAIVSPLAIRSMMDSPPAGQPATST